MKTKILILHTAIGYGIKVTAENIAESLRASGEYEVRVSDVGEVEKGIFSKLLAKAYLFVHERLSFLWGFLYFSKTVLYLSLPFRKFIASFKSKRVLALLREFQPAIVISTQAIPSAIIAYLKAKGLYRGKLAIVFSDYHLHRFWLYREADLYVCNIEEQVAELKRLGIRAEEIVLTGTIVSEKYLNQLDKEQALRSFGLLTSMPTVLVSGGSRGLLNAREVLLALARTPRSFQIVVVCGKNENLKKELEKISSPHRHPIKILGFVSNQDVLMSAADLLIGKVGGPTIAEAVAKRLPIILTSPHPGHEMANLEFLVKHGIVAFGRIPREVAFLTEQILDGRQKFNKERSFVQLISPKNRISVLEMVARIAPPPPEV